MRKERIKSLHRKHTPPTETPLFYRSAADPPGMLRRLADPETLLKLDDVTDQYCLEAEEPDFARMTFEEMGNFISQVGRKKSHAPDGRTIGTIPYAPDNDPASPFYGKNIVVPQIEMFRGQAKVS
jgi:hypothetical protein